MTELFKIDQMPWQAEPIKPAFIHQKYLLPPKGIMC